MWDNGAVTPEQITIVQTTVASLSSESLDALVRDFYARLFDADPDAAALFAGDVTAQRHRFSAALVTVIGAIRRLDAFTAEGAALGRRHQAYGVRAAHYRIAGDALLEALGASLGSEWTPAVAEAWALAYHLTVTAMTTDSTAAET